MIDWKKVTKKSSPNPYQNIKHFVRKDQYIKENCIVEVKNLAHSFGRKDIYKDISFEIYENERVAFLGPNGAGKTLTISTVCGFLKEKKGTIKYLFEYEKTPYEKLSVQFQDLKFPTSLTPKDLIEFTIKLTNFQKNEEELIEGMKAFEIDSILNTKISKLSGGQQQRVNVFIAMIGRPKILFLDEFTTGLDISIKNKLQEYIMEYCQKNKITLVIISHDIDCITEMVDRIIILANKQIMVDAYVEDINKEFGSVKNLLKKYIVV